MLEVLQFVFEDFWRFLGVCVLLMIAALWKPIDVTVLHGYNRKEKEDDA